MTNYPIILIVSLLFFLSPEILFFTEVAMAQNTTVPVNVGVVLDFNPWVRKMGYLSCISMSLSDFYASHGYYKTRLVLHTRDSKRDVVGAAAAALDLIKNVQVQAIIGPVTSMQANFVIGLGDKAQVPIISFSATSPSLTSLRSSYFFRATQNDSFQVKAISAIVQAFGWREAVPIYIDNEYGEGVIPYLADALQEVDTRIPYRSVIHPSATDDQIVQELYKLMTMPTRVFIVHMLPALSSRLFTKAKEIGMMNEGYVWIMTDGITNLLSSIKPSVIDSMQGVLGVRTHVPKKAEVENFRIRWKRKFLRENPTIVDAELDIYRLWAYDATLALAIAVEEVGVANFGFQKTSMSSNSTTVLDTTVVSQSGQKLRQALASTRFKGLAGDFGFVNGQLQSSAFQIINVNGNGGRKIGFWTPERGLIKKMKSTKTGTFSTNSKDNLGPIIWPGDSTSVPKGWEIPTNGKKLKIGVPVKDGFDEFVKVTRDPGNNTTSTDVTGYCIDVFNAVRQALPYAVTPEFVPFATPDGEKAGDYNDLVYQVYLGKYDAVVGDITITANRSLNVDFTLPFTESGVYMIVPIKDKKRKSLWVFLEPLTWNLWVSSACFFVFIGFVVWVLEHRINEDFGGTLSHQVGISLWFSFSTMVFAHRERVMTNLARIVVIIWVFVVLILSQSYTASLASRLTVQNLQPTITDVNALIKNGENVGYQDGSFVLGILKRLGFDESKLRVYHSPEECDEAFTKGTANGGIAAAFDESPYMKLFLAKYCSKYTMMEPKFKIDGFGFVFPKGSPLVPDVSRAILNVAEGDKMRAIEKTWFGNQSSCPEPSTSVSPDSLGLDCFGGLFLVAMGVSLLAFIIYISMFLYEHREVLRSFDREDSIWSRIVVLFAHFDQRDLSSHKFRRSGLQVRSPIASVQNVSATEGPSNTNPPTLSTHSNGTDSNSASLGVQGLPAEHGDTNANGQAVQEITSATDQLPNQIKRDQELLK